MIELAMHIMDIVENSVRAGADKVSISIDEEENEDKLILEIRDNGMGMDDGMVQNALDPFVTTKNGKKIGLGLSMLADAAEKSGGKMVLDSKRGKGTTVKAVFGLTHMDRQPMGNILETMIVLIVGNPGVEFECSYSKNKRVQYWSTSNLKEQFSDNFLCHPEVMDYIREKLNFLKWIA